MLEHSDHRDNNKPIKLRLAAMLSVIMMAASFVRNLPLSAFIASAAESATDETEAAETDIYEDDIFPDEPELIIEEDARSEVTASYIPLSADEELALQRQLVLRYRRSRGMIREAAGSGFTPDNQNDIVNNALKQFKLEYVFTSPEPYEGDTSSYIERDNNFVVKARLTINTEHAIEPGNMEFRLPGALFPNRDGGYCRIKAVAVSKFNSEPAKSDSPDQIYDPASVSANHEESVAPFNYYIDSVTGEYVFVNYDSLHSSSNMIEISFERVEVFDVKDQTTWDIEPETHIIYDMEETGTLNGAEDIYTHYKYTEEGTETDLYQLMRAQNNAGEKIFVYYDVNGTPKYIDTVVNGSHTWRKVNDAATPATELTDLMTAAFSSEIEMPDGTEPQVITNPYPLEKTGSGISGKVNTEVDLDSVTKTPAADTGKGYGAQLYTIGQMNRYIDTTNLAAKGVLTDSGKLSDEYVYTCWSVNTKGTCTQPWTMLFEENPLTASLKDVTAEVEAGTYTGTYYEGYIINDNDEKETRYYAYEVDENGDILYTEVTNAKVLGVTTIRPNGSFHYDSEIASGSSDISKMYQYVSADVLAEDNQDGYSDFWYAADSNADMRNTFGLGDVATDKKFNVGYYVVVAYPKDAISSYLTDEYGAKVTHYAQLSNKITAHLYSRDERQEQTSNRATDLPIMLSDYNWKGGGDSWYSNKYVDGDDKEGVLSVIDELKKTIDTDPNTQQYLGGIVFHENYSAGYYNTCHTTKDDYSYRQGMYYQIVNVDDVMTALPYGYITEDNTLKEIYGKPYTLTGDDYFYSRAVLAVSEQDIDPFEDEKLKLTSTYIDAYRDAFTLPDNSTLADAYRAIDADLKSNGVSNGLDWIVYGWFAKNDGTAAEGWTEIDMSAFRSAAVKEKLSPEAAANPHITMEEYIACMDKDGKYQITMNFMDHNGIAECPYRVKVVHNSVAYDSDAAFTLTTQLKVTSENLSLAKRHENLYYETGAPLPDDHGDLDSFRINLKNYSANTVTTYNYATAGNKKINIWYDDTDPSKSSYRNYESNHYWSYINGNRYDFLTRDDMKKLYSSMTGANYWHVALEDRTKSALGEVLLGTDSAGAALPGPYGVSEYLPFDYIAPELTAHTYSTPEEFLADNRHIIRNIASIDISEMEKNSKAGKYASWENDTRKGQVLMTYTLYGYEGYKLSKELEPIIIETHASDQPMRRTVVLCDLLPAGVNYYGSSAPVCGKLTSTNIGRTGYPVNEDDVNNFVDTWDTSKAEIIKTEVFDNWEDGRTLVRFTVQYSEDTGIMNSNSWYIGSGIRFKAYVSWDNYTSAAEKDNIFAYVAADNYNSGNIYGRWTGSQDSQVYDDAGNVIPKTESNNPSMDYTPFKNKTDLDGDGYEGGETEVIGGSTVTWKEHNRMYGHANEMDTITMARTLGIKKSVKADADLYSDYENKDSVVAGKGYTYKIHIDKTEQGIAGDLVVFDKLEAVTPSTWKGTFVGVDLNEVRSEYPDANAEIWYSESLDAPTELYALKDEAGNIYHYTDPDNSSHSYDVYTFDSDETVTVGSVEYKAVHVPWNFTNANSVFDRTDKTFVEGDKNYPYSKHAINNGTEDTVLREWVRSAVWETAGNTNADVHSVAIDFGDSLKLEGDAAVVNVYIKMKAPAYDESFKYTFNRSSFYFQDYIRSGDSTVPAGTFEYSGSNITTMTIGQRRRVEVAKKIPLEASVSDELLEQAEFTFQVTNREYIAGAADDTNPDHVNNVLEGDYNFANIGYDLYKTNDKGATWYQVEKGMIHATDDNGEFKLKYGYKAVFDEISAYTPKDGETPIQKYDFDNYTIIEKSVPYWLGVKNLTVDDIPNIVKGYQYASFEYDGRTVTLCIMPSEHETGYECYYFDTDGTTPIYCNAENAVLYNGYRGSHSTDPGYNKKSITERFKLDYEIPGDVTFPEYSEQRASEFVDSLKEIAVENFYRPVVYITKNPKGVPDGTTVDKTFTYKLRIYEDRNPETGREYTSADVGTVSGVQEITDPGTGAVRYAKPLTVTDLTNGAYTILNKTIGKTTTNGGTTASQNAFTDVREDGKLYWYKVDGSAGLYECPPGWDQENDQANLYNGVKESYDPDIPETAGIICSDVKSDDKGAYYEITFNTDITHTVALPVYIKHLVSGSEVGMLYQEGDITYARYSFTITEVNPEGSDWFCDTVEYGGTFGTGENAFEWTNTYKYKELLLTKNVTHAPANLSDISFTFRLTDKDGNPYCKYKETDGAITWTLCTMDSEGNITAKTGAGTTGTVGTDGKFTVKGCGNDADSSGDRIVVRLSYVSLGSSGSAAKYTITEILPDREDGTDADTATTTEYLAVKETDTVQVKQNIPYSNLTVENDYLKRDITVRKVVASATSPGTRNFAMVLCPVGLTAQPSESLTGTKSDNSSLTATPISTPKYGWRFELEDSESVTFKEIGVVGDKFELYEYLDTTFGLLTREDETVYIGNYGKVTTFTLDSAEDSSADVVNGTEGYIVLRKKYTGTTEGIDLAADEITFDLKLKNNSGAYETVDFSNGEVQIIGEPTTFASTKDLKVKDGQTCVVNLQALSRRLTGSSDALCDFEITETDWTKSKLIGDDWYVIEPENANAIWEFDSETKQGIFTNVVTKFSAENAIYKRIGYKDTEAEKPTGVITFKVTNKAGEPVKNVRCTAIKNDDTLIGYNAVSDENGLISIDFSDTAFSSEEGWKTEEGVRQYFLKLYFDRAVKINAAADDILRITEVGTETDKTWGTLIGYEIYGDSDTTVTGMLLNGNAPTNWTLTDANTFVNVQETEQITVQKVVNPTGEELTDADTSAEFRYMLYQLIGGNAEAAPHISYSVYDITDTEMTTPKRTGTTDDAETGIFTLHHGEKAVFDLPKNARWRITEDNSGSYKLVTDAADVIRHDTIEGDKDHALYGDEGDDTDEAIAHRNPASGYTYEGFAIDAKDPPTTVTLYIVPDSENADAGYKCWYINAQGNSVPVTDDKIGSHKADADYAGKNIGQRFLTDFDLTASAASLKDYYAITVKEVMYGFELNTTQDLENEAPLPEPVVLPFDVVVVCAEAKKNQFMFAAYDESQDSADLMDDGSTVISRVRKFKEGQNNKNNYYTNMSNDAGNYTNRYSPSAKNTLCNNTYILGYANSDYPYATSIYADSSCNTKIWVLSSSPATQGQYHFGNNNPASTWLIPETVFFANSDGKVEEHRVVGIAKDAYALASRPTSLKIPKYIKKIGDNAFYQLKPLKYVTFDCENLKAIGAYAFKLSGLNNITIPSTVECIEKGAFESINGTGSSSVHKLIIFETKNASNFYLPDSILVDSNTYVVFTNLTESQVASAEWKTNIKVDGLMTRFYYKDTLSGDDVTTITNACGKTNGVDNLSAETKALLNSVVAANSSPSPLPKPSPKPTEPLNISQLLYVERKKLMIVSE